MLELTPLSFATVFRDKHGYTGSVHALYRFLNREVVTTPEATMKLDFAVGEMAQVDFGMGPLITERGEIRGQL